MKAITLTAANNLILSEFETPTPREEEVLIQLKAASFNPIDYQMRERPYERKKMHSPILGREFSGIITALGKNTTQFKIGDQVFGSTGNFASNGSYAEYLSIPEAVIAHMPKNISFEQATAIPSAGITALQAFKRMKAKPYEKILITGASGGVGAMLLKVFLAKGYKYIFTTIGNEERRQYLISLGIKDKHIVNYKLADLPTYLIGQNKGQYFDFVVDNVGETLSETAASVLKHHGTYVDITALSTTVAREVLFDKGCTIINISHFYYAAQKKYEYYQESLAEISSMIESGKILPPQIEIIGNLDPNMAEKAHYRLRNNQTKGKKLIIKISSP
ncbi:NADP-dependent oxidoreductase [Pedobacter sp. ASV28]|uniref:quinone oxidoreductase family protein n=1 Tax=Pedobacter sp. ASV28 TaxID=2795123 RepID=UPI0018EA4B3D|nr:NADP-dependent oxidoreductase [Pedobacter sp. ASV28]